MHFVALVAADDVVAALMPFRTHDEFPKYRRECWCTRGVDDDFGASAAPNCRMCRGTGAVDSDQNPIGRWDSFVVTAGKMRRLVGARVLRHRDEYRGLCWEPSWVGSSEHHFPQRRLDGDWDQAHKRDLDLHAMWNDGFLPYAMIVDGTWHQSDDWGWFPSLSRISQRIEFVNNWAPHARRVLEELPNETLLTLVDCHG